MKQYYVEDVVKASGNKAMQKAESMGVSALRDAELLAILIGESKSESAEVRAMKLLAGRSMRDIASMYPEELKILGLTKKQALVVASAFEISKRTCIGNDRLPVSDQNEAYRLFKDMSLLKMEQVRIAMLDNRSHLMQIETVSIGKINGADSNPREVFAPAIKKGAYSIIVAHNHPSGLAEPSASDIITTQTLAKSGQILQIPVVDHLIIGEGCYYSFRESMPEVFE